MAKFCYIHESSMSYFSFHLLHKNLVHTFLRSLSAVSSILQFQYQFISTFRGHTTFSFSNRELQFLPAPLCRHYNNLILQTLLKPRLILICIGFVSTQQYYPLAYSQHQQIYRVVFVVILQMSQTHIRNMSTAIWLLRGTLVFCYTWKYYSVCIERKEMWSW